MVSRTIGSCAVLLLFVALEAFCGPMPMPIEADLDLAARVVVGKIVALEPKERGGSYVTWATATIDVRRTLKGEPQDTLHCIVATEVDPAHAMAMASPPRVHRIGDDGIWLVLPDGDLSHFYGLLEEKDEPIVKRFLAELEHRTWSEPANGLRAWSKPTQADYRRKGALPVVIFAVQNVTDHVVYCPMATENVVRLLAVDAAGVERTVREDDEQRDNEKVYCLALQPEQIRYLHRYESFIYPGRLLPPGKYDLTVILSNTRERGQWEGKDVEAWTGEVSAPAIVTYWNAATR